MPSLDPIVSLAVGMAESPGLYAFVLGSGVSRDAGVPTGGEVLQIARSDLYRLQTTKTHAAGEQELTEWLERESYASLNYSEILAMLAPDPAGRRAYLAKYFEGREPADTHKLLATLTAEGMVRVFVTTNFDRLLETALAAVGPRPVVVTSASDLHRASEREHAPVYVMKPHGDYLQQTIRNTAEELLKLEAEVEHETQEIFDRYGLVVVGYSGSDPAIARLLRARNSRHSLYWVSRAEPTGEVAALVEALHGRVILRETAAEFLRDLTLRINAFQAHPSGDTPDAVAAEVVSLMRGNDEIGLRVLLKEEWRAFRERLRDAIEPLKGDTTAARAVEFEQQMMPGLERLLGAMLPFIEHESSLFDEQAVEMVRITERAMEQGSGMWAPELGQWAMWLLAKACGAFAVCTENYAAVGSLLRTRVDQFTKSGSVASMLLRQVGQEAAKAVMAQYGDQRWIAPHWEHLYQRLSESRFLQERYPELFEDPGILQWLAAFDFLTSYGALRAGENPVIAYWAMTGQGAVNFARRLARNEEFRDDVARGAFGISGADFAESARQTLTDAQRDPGKRLFRPDGLPMLADAIEMLP